MTKKILFLLTFLLTTLGGGKVYAFRYVITWYDGNVHQSRNDGGSGNFFDWDSGKHNINPKFADPNNMPSYKDDVYGSITFAYGLKMEDDNENPTNGTSLNFTITGTSTLTILKSTHSGSSGTIKLHNNTTNSDVGTYDGDDTGKGYKEIRIPELTAGSYSIKRGSGESGLLYVRVTDDANMTMSVNATDLMYGSYDGNSARIQVTDEFAYVEPATYSYSGNTWLRMKLNCSTALSAVTDVTLSSSEPLVIATDDTSHDYFVNSDNLAVYYFVKVVGYSSDPVTITFTHSATSSTTSKSFTVNPGTMTAYNNSYPYKWDFQNNEWTSSRLQAQQYSGEWTSNSTEIRNKGNVSSSNVNMVKGLSFTAGAGGICLDWTNHCLWMAAGTTVVIPNLSIGQVVTVNANKSFTANNSTRMDNNKFYVTSTGDLTLTAPDDAYGVYVYSIDVSATGQATYHTTSAGVFEFTGNGSLAGGTVIKDVPGIEMTIGSSDNSLNVNNADDHLTYSSECQLYTFTPKVNGYLTINVFGTIQHLRLKENGTNYDDLGLINPAKQQQFSLPLKAGKSYTINEEQNVWLHSFSFEPAYLNTAGTGRQSAESPAVFTATGSTTEFPSILTDANEYVTFAASEGGAITVAANGNGTPTLVTPTTSAYTITATVASPNSSVTSKTASYQLIYSATPITLSFKWTSPCNTDYGENKTYKNDVTATAGGYDVTNQIETWTYTSSDPTIATVTSDGTVTILNSGTIEITVTATDAQGVYQSATASYWLTINTTATPTLTLSNGIGAKSIIYGKETYSNVGSVNVEGPEITYESDDPTVAIVNSSGVVTPVKPSATPVTITVRSSQYKQYAAASQTYSVTVNKGSITLNFIPENVILNQGESITPYINFSGSVKSDIDKNIKVTTSNASIASLQSTPFTLHTKMEGGVEKIDIIDVQITAASISGSSDQTATVTVSINGSDYYNDVSTTCNVKVRATAQKNFSWANGQATPVYTIYQGDFMMVPAISGNCSQNNSYSLASNKKYAKKIKYDQSANMEDSKNYRAKEGVPDYLIVNADGNGDAPAADAENSNTYAWILYARSENTRASAYPDSLMVYGKIDNGTKDHIVYLRAQDPNHTGYYCDAKIIIKPKSDLDAKVTTDVTEMSFPFTWDFTSISNDDMTLIANDNVYYESNKANTGYYLSTGFMNSQDSYVIKDGDNYRKTPSVEKPTNLYFQNFVVQDGNSGLKTLKPFKGLKVSMAQTRYNSKVDRVRIFQNHLYFNGGPTEILLPSVASMPSSFKVFVKIKSNGTKPMYFKQGSGAKVTQSLSGSDQIVSFDATSTGGDITLQFQDCTVYWIACSTEAKNLSYFKHSNSHLTYAAAAYSYPEDLDLSKSNEVNGATAYYASDFTTDNKDAGAFADDGNQYAVVMKPLANLGTYVTAGTGMLLRYDNVTGIDVSKKDATIPFYMIANPRNVETYSAAETIKGEGVTNYLVGTGANAKQIDGRGTDYTNFMMSAAYKYYTDITDVNTAQGGYRFDRDWSFYPVMNSGEVEAQKSYLCIPANLYVDKNGKIVEMPSSSRRTAGESAEAPASKAALAIVFDDDLSNGQGTTGISTVATEITNDSDAWYTLQGVRVETPTKGGIYIHKGRKIVVK